MIGVYLALLAVTGVLFKAVPSGFVPQQDKQYLIGFAQLPDGATLDRTEDVMRRMGEIMMKQPGVENAVGFPGLSINGFTNSSNAGHRVRRAQVVRRAQSTRACRGGAIAGSSTSSSPRIQDAFIVIFPPPPVPGLGTTGGFKLYLEDRASLGYEALDQATKAFMAKAYQSPELAGMFTTYQVNVPQLYADIDRTKARQLGVPVTEVFDTMQIYLGSLYVNDFNKFGRTYSVRVQADAPYRARAEDVGLLKVRSNTGEMVPLSALMNVRNAAGPERAMRYNGFLAADINGSAAPGYSSGQAQDAIERIAAETLPPGIGYEWTEITYQEILAGNSATWVFPLAILLVFLVLAALYESLALPLAIILIVPHGPAGAALTGVWLTDGDNNIFTQIGFMVLVGLAAKNAILIVEFARELEFAGRTPVQAAIEASRLRLRPILMTSIAFVMGVVPLAFSAGAGAEMRQAMGIAVFAGMIGVTAFGIFLTPVFYVLLRALTGNRPLKHHGEVPALGERRGCVEAGQPDEGHRMRKRGLSLIFAAARRLRDLAADGRRRQAAARAAGGVQGEMDRSPRPAEAQPRGEWWKAFNDPVLDELVERADRGNASVRVAAARLAQARALARDHRCRPLAAGRAWARMRGAPAGPRSTAAPERRATCSAPAPISPTRSTCSAGCRTRPRRRSSTRRRAKACCRARACWCRPRWRRPISRCARSTPSARWCRSTLDGLSRNARLTERRWRAGDVAELDVARASTEVAATESEALALDRRRAELEHALAVLLGESPSQFALQDAEWKHRAAGHPGRRAEHGAHAPARRRRPRSNTMLAAQSRVGVAKAAWFPNIALTGFGGYASSDLDDLFQWSARAWGSARCSRCRCSTAAGARPASRTPARSSTARWRATASRCWSRSRTSKTSSPRCACSPSRPRRRRAPSPRRAAPPSLSGTRYRNGYVSQLELLDAQRSELRNRRQALQVRSDRYQSTVALVRALGGGWE